LISLRIWEVKEAEEVEEGKTRLRR
jgi:hypothetical protein